ncbi:cobalamin biosynthesis protein [Acidimangrovimonas sediminis]|uniref:cobalamin biosynthesis protein n=1 Tax=Acidimangrovimonas sediminis TaxID=2056283 RepID=UPI000C7FB066|nr:cobalamin biosynthesis protein [Acidimangrovimonas sediminis]
MRVAGLGFRRGTSAAALGDALARAGGGRLDALATAAEKATAPALRHLAEAMNLPILALPPEALAGVPTATHSPRVVARFGTGSLAEAAALAGAGPGARLIAPRTVSADRTATAAIAERIPS